MTFQSLRIACQCFVLAVILLLWNGLAWSQSPDQERIPTAGPAELIEILKRNVWPDIDLVTRMAAQRRLEEFGREAPSTVVPLLTGELSAPRQYDVKATHQRLALIETLRDIGPFAENAVPVLAEIKHDPDESNEWVKMAAEMALRQIGEPVSEDATEAAAASYRANDRAEALDLITARNLEGLAELLWGLPDDRSGALTETLMAHDDQEIAYVAAATQVQRNANDEALTRLVELALLDEKGPDLLMGVAWSLMHSGDEVRYHDTMRRLVEELNAQLEGASPEVQERFMSTTPTPSTQE